MASGFSLVQEITVREHAFVGTLVDDMSLYFVEPSDPLGPRAPSSWARGEKPVLSTLSVPDSRGIDSGPFIDLRLEAVLPGVLALNSARTDRER